MKYPRALPRFGVGKPFKGVPCLKPFCLFAPLAPRKPFSLSRRPTIRVGGLGFREFRGFRGLGFRD